MRYIYFVDLFPECAEFPECRLTDIGSEYRGQISQTRSGIECISWNKVQSISGSESLSVLDANYCRNPDKKSEGPWCYTDVDTWDYCAIPFCKR